MFNHPITIMSVLVNDINHLHHNMVCFCETTLVLPPREVRLAGRGWTLDRPAPSLAPADDEHWRYPLCEEGRGWGIHQNHPYLRRKRRLLILLLQNLLPHTCVPWEHGDWSLFIFIIFIHFLFVVLFSLIYAPCTSVMRLAPIICTLGLELKLLLSFVQPFLPLRIIQYYKSLHKRIIKE